MAKTSMQKTAAVTALLTASIGNAFSQEPRAADKLGEPSASASAPLEPAGVLLNENGSLIGEVDAILTETQDSENGLKESYFPRVPKSSSDLLADILRDIRREDFDSRVYRTISGNTGDDIVISYRLTSLRTNPDVRDSLKVSPAFVEYELPLFEAVRFEDRLREKKIRDSRTLW